MDVVYFSLWFILSSLDLLSSSFLHFSSNWVFGGSGLWLNISFLRIPFLKLVFLGYHQLLASLCGLCQKYLQYIMYTYKNKNFLLKCQPQKPDLTTTPQKNTGGTNRLPHAKVGHSSTNQSQKRTSQQSGASGGAAVRRSGGLGRLLGLQRLNQRLTLARWGRDGSMELMWSKEMLLFVVFLKNKGSLQAKKTILTVWDGNLEPSLLRFGWDFKVVEPPYLNLGMVKVRMWHAELVDMLWSKRLS